MGWSDSSTDRLTTKNKELASHRVFQDALELTLLASNSRSTVTQRLILLGGLEHQDQKYRCS